MGRKATDRARELGREAGRAAATWYFDGNTADETYAAVRRGIDEGDPAILDTFKVPDLSGEWADSPTPASIMAEVYARPERHADAEDDVCRAWEDGAQEGYIEEIDRALRAQLS